MQFAGPSCDLRIVLDDAGASSIRLDIPSREAFDVGDRVTLSVSGKAHVFR
jgi:iron(III) transport system ATP-binding protein